MSEKLHIALTFDDNFWAPAYATMRSVCLATRRRKDIVFHLCHLDLTAEHRQRLDRITQEFGAAIFDYDLGKTDIFDTKIAELPKTRSGRWNRIIYARIFLSDILPDDINHIVYLDCDVLVRIDIEKLYNLSLSKNIAAAVLDPMRTGFQTLRNFELKPAFDPAEPYFNSGVMLIDLSKFSKINILQELEAKVGKAGISDLFFDQDILNIVLAGRWRVLSHRWNYQNPRIGDESIDPFILHFTGKKKPWNLMGRIGYKRIYRNTMTNQVFFQYWRERFLKRWLGIFGFGRGAR